MICEPMEPDEEGWSEWIHPLPGYLMQCCDCGLIHQMEFAIVPAHDNIFFVKDRGETKNKAIIFRAKRYNDGE